MLKEIVYTPYSRECLKDILDYISKDSIVRANIFIDEITNFITNLEKFPNLGVEIELGRRKLLFNKNYKIIYVIKDNKIYILFVTNVKLN